MSVNPQLGSRALFSSLQAEAYLAHAAISPVSDPVRTAMLGVADRAARHGVGAFGQVLETRERLRGQLAALIGAQPESLGFVLNTGHGLAAVATSVPMGPGDRIALFQGEYPSNVSVFQQAARRCGASVVWLNAQDFATDTEAALAHLAEELGKGLSLVAVSAVQFSTGLRMPLARIGALCRQHGTWLSVDGVQALGAVPLQVEEAKIDFLACGAHKWWMGQEGAGFVYVRPAVMELIQPQLVGHMSHRGAMDVLVGEPNQLHYDRPLLTTPQVFEGGMLASSALAGWDASAALIAELGVPAIFEHIQGYHDRLEPELLTRGFKSLRCGEPELRSGILAVVPPAGIHAGKLAAGLAVRGVYVSCPNGVLRLAPHWPNHVAEIPVLLAALDAVLGDADVRV